MSNIQECIDCNWYDDVNEGDTFLYAFGDNDYICALCGEARGIETY